MVLNLGKYGNGGTIAVSCFSKGKRRGGFTHNATGVLANGELVTAKVSYVNRTWESYPFQTVLKCFCEKLAIALYGVPSASALWKTRKWEAARDCANFLMAQV